MVNVVSTWESFAEALEASRANEVQPSTVHATAQLVVSAGWTVTLKNFGPPLTRRA